MPTVTVVQPSDGQTADANDVNSQVNAILAVVNGHIDQDNLADSGVTNSKLAGSIDVSKLAANVGAGWIPGLDTPNTVTYNGNRNYSLVFNAVDLTPTLSNGMRLKLTRTVTAPTQCTSLNGSTQSFSRASASLTGISFTTTATAMAWIKPSAYQQGGIVTRFNGTNGFLFYLNAAGQIAVQSGSGGAATSYQSVPLNKWTHVAASYSSGTVLIYIDGLLVSSTGSPTASVTQAGNLEIGSMNGASFFAGKIAQAALFSAVVNAATIQSYISQGLAGSETALISAYSFNGVLTDLNANANTLTANGSAVATNVGSPFAGGANASTAYTAGTTEFGEVFNVSFSTNTTLIVQVPDGYNIPTSGGVSAVSYSTQAAPLGWTAGAGGIRNLYTGLICSARTTTSSLTSIFSITPYIPSGRQVRLSVVASDCKDSGANGGTSIVIAKDAVQLISSIFFPLLANVEHSHTPVCPDYPTTGTHIYSVNLGEVGGVGTATFAGSTTNPVVFTADLV